MARKIKVYEVSDKSTLVPIFEVLARMSGPRAAYSLS